MQVKLWEHIIIMSCSGDEFYIAEYKGNKHLADFVNGKIYLYSDEKLTADSYIYENCYSTDLEITDVDNFFKVKMFVSYKGNEYSASSISSGMREVRINAREDYEKEDIEKNGFECNQIDQYTRLITKTIKKEDIEDVRIEEISVYEEFLMKYGSR